MNHFDLGILIQYITGHAHLRKLNEIADTAQPTAIPFPENKYALTNPDEQMFTDNAVNYDNYEVRCRKCKLKG